MMSDKGRIVRVKFRPIGCAAHLQSPYAVLSPGLSPVALPHALVQMLVLLSHPLGGSMRPCLSCPAVHIWFPEMSRLPVHQVGGRESSPFV